MAETIKQIFSVNKVLSMLDLDHTQSGSDLDINYLYDDSGISDLDDDSIVMEEPPEGHVPIEEHMERNEPVCQSIPKK